MSQYNEERFIKNRTLRNKSKVTVKSEATLGASIDETLVVGQMIASI